MIRDPAFFFDLADPASYLVGCLVDEAGAEGIVDWRGYELRPPTMPPIDPADTAWAAHQAQMQEYAEALGVPMVPPAFIPRTRKAHELLEFAREKGRYAELRRALFEAHFVGQTDIGRIDLLAGIAAQAGLDGHEARTVLGVDRCTAAVLANRALAEERGISAIPVLVFGNRRLEGVPSPCDVKQWLEATEAAVGCSESPRSQT